ncbi:MAG: hypothetical protein PF439_07915 [Helicobacteraceae bacterium]|jgi:hypothetical protein|nr:hypothetical protein [Helicobacteraceae bacterium]
MLRKSVGSLMLLASVYASAGENYFANEWDAKGLLALEGFGGTAQTKLTQDYPGGGDYVIQSKSGTSVGGGLKLGGESKNYRLFLSARYHEVEDYDYVSTIGVEVQYLIRAGEHFNIFLGLNGGGMGTQTTINSVEYSTKNPYAGGDAGVNIDIVENLGVELGLRYNKAFYDSSEIGAVDYLAEAYASIVFKFTGDY